METPLELKLKDEDPWHVAKAASDIIISYLKEEAHSPPVVAPVASALDALSPTKRTLLDGEKREEPTSFLLEVWETLLGIARQIPCDHPAQDRLVALVLALDRPSDPDPDEPETSGQTIFTGLVELENSIRFVWIEPSDAEDTVEPFLEWVNLNSFVARVVGAQILPRFWDFGFWAMRWSLEHTGKPATDAVECRLATAAQWILHDGRNLRSRLQDWGASDDDRRRHQSAFFEGETTFSPARWQFWKARLRDADQMVVSEDIKATALQAVGVMEEIEKDFTEVA